MSRRRKKDDNAINLDSFLDILTCLVGVLVLIIILTSIDASQTKLLIPTPLSHPTNKKPVFIECRNNLLYYINMDEINQKIDTRMREITQQADGNEQEAMRLIQNSTIETDYYSVDLTYALIGQKALRPIPDAEGYSLDNITFSDGTSISDMLDGWLENIFNSIDSEKEIITFLVRDDSFKVFKKARAIAWWMQVEVSYELLDLSDPIKFGLHGRASLAQ